LQNKPITDWNEHDFENFVLSCDSKHDPELPDFIYEARKAEISQKPKVYKKKSPQELYFPFKQTNMRATIAELQESLEKLKMQMLQKNSGSVKMGQTTNIFPRIKVNFVKQNMQVNTDKTKSGLKTSRAENSLERFSKTKPNDEKQGSAPKINDFTKVKSLYDSVLAQMKQRYKPFHQQSVGLS